VSAVGPDQRILFVVDGLSGGGAEKSLLTVAAELADRGHEVAVASLRPEQVYAIPPSVELIRAHDSRARALRKIGEISRRARQLDRALAGRPEPDLTVSTLLTTDRIVAASRLRDEAWYRVPNALSVEQLHGVDVLKRSRRNARLRRTYGGRKVIAISAGVGRDLVNAIGIAPARLEVIPNPFDTETIRRLADEPCPFEGEDFVVSVGRFVPQKRHDRLLAAFARSSYAGKLVLLGTGPPARVRAVRKRAEALGVRDRLELVGFQRNPYPFLRHARASILASDHEGFGRVLVESLICGTPAVSTRCPHGPDEILTDGLAIGLAELTPESLASALDRVLSDPPPIGPRHYERFSAERIADRYLALSGTDPSAGA
jgi:glycosyltransferase involved in cell wall biosynthesis